MRALRGTFVDPSSGRTVRSSTPSGGGVHASAARSSVAVVTAIAAQPATSVQIERWPAPMRSGSRSTPPPVNAGQRRDGEKREQDRTARAAARRAAAADDVAVVGGRVVAGVGGGARAGVGWIA